ncbi:MAG: hypothetical protein M1826_002468 [Phylliscum demangeonii]|nr:MAG: hypothetical protein M1826_002468 [Phylliscum demangeonii]
MATNYKCPEFSKEELWSMSGDQLRAAGLVFTLKDDAQLTEEELERLRALIHPPASRPVDANALEVRLNFEPSILAVLDLELCHQTNVDP